MFCPELTYLSINIKTLHIGLINSKLRSLMYSFPTHKLKPGVIDRIPLVLKYLLNLGHSRLWLLLTRNLSTSANVWYSLLIILEMAQDYFSSSKEYALIGAYFSPVSDAYAKPGLADGSHRYLIAI